MTYISVSGDQAYKVQEGGVISLHYRFQSIYYLAQRKKYETFIEKYPWAVKGNMVEVGFPYERIEDRVTNCVIERVQEIYCDFDDEYVFEVKLRGLPQ